MIWPNYDTLIENPKHYSVQIYISYQNLSQKYIQNPIAIIFVRWFCKKQQCLFTNIPPSWTRWKYLLTKLGTKNGFKNVKGQQYRYFNQSFSSFTFFQHLSTFFSSTYLARYSSFEQKKTIKQYPLGLWTCFRNYGSILRWKVLSWVHKNQIVLQSIFQKVTKIEI